MTHQNGIESLSLKDVEKLRNNKSISAANEIININNPVVSTNMKKMFKKMLQVDKSIWSAIYCMEVQQEEIKGLIYPSAIMYMTLWMQQNCIRFGNVLFLDAQ